MKTIYMDHAATTAVSQCALEEMLPDFSEEYGNPSAVYSYGQTGKNAVEKCREGAYHQKWFHAKRMLFPRVIFALIPAGAITAWPFFPAIRVARERFCLASVALMMVLVAIRFK